MKKSVILLTILLIASLAGTYAVYEFYVKERMKDLAENLEREKQLTSRISKLEETFYGTEPSVIVQEWRQATQPWSDAVERRTGFFAIDLGLEPFKVPEESIPRFVWRDEIPRRIQALRDYAEQKNVIVQDFNCGVPSYDSFKAGTNPSKKEIEDLFSKYDYCASLTRMLIDAGPESLSPLVIWPEGESPLRSGGKLNERTTGVSMKIRMQPLVRFLDSLSQSERYFRVEGIQMSNSDLLNPDPLLSVDFVLTQAKYVPDVRRTTAAGGGVLGASGSSAAQDLFGGLRARQNAAVEEEKQPSWFQQFRRNWLPF